jgi:single-strand DNA-binding protein
MASLNHIFMVGNLTRDPEVRYTPSGSAVGELRLASTRVYLVEGQKKEETCFIDVVVWGKQAEVCREYLSKGSPILVEGILQFDQWKSESGENRSKHRIRADRVQFLGRPRGGGGGGEMGDAPGAAEGDAAPARPAPRAAATPPPAPQAGGADQAGDADDLPF